MLLILNFIFYLQFLYSKQLNNLFFEFILKLTYWIFLFSFIYLNFKKKSIKIINIIIFLTL